MQILQRTSVDVLVQFRVAGEPASVPRWLRDLGTETPKQQIERFAMYESNTGLLTFHARNVVPRGFATQLVATGYRVVEADVQRRVGDPAYVYRPLGVNAVYGFRLSRTVCPQHEAYQLFDELLTRRWQIAHGHHSDDASSVNIRFNYDIPFPLQYKLSEADEWGFSHVLSRTKAHKKMQKAAHV